jgi:hypothetical protein
MMNLCDENIICRSTEKKYLSFQYYATTNVLKSKFDVHSIYSRRLPFDISPPVFIFSTLLELHVNVTHFYDCIYLLDRRFSQLRVFHVNTFWIRRS